MAKTSDIAEMQTWYSETPCARPTVGVEMDDQVLTITDDLPHDAAISVFEIDAIERLSDAGRLTMGESVRRFEDAFAAHLGMKHAVMLNSGSSANSTSAGGR